MAYITEIYEIFSSDFRFKRQGIILFMELQKNEKYSNLINNGLRLIK